MNLTLEREWSLFRDWCEATDIDAVPAGRTAVAAFMATFPAAPSTWRRRIQAIRGGLEEAGYSLDWAKPAVASVFREGERWATARQAIAQLPTVRFPTGLRGRRDAWLVLLVGELGFTRREAQQITETDISLFPELTIRGRTVHRAEDPAECPRCAATRWLRVYGPAAFGFSNETKEILNPWGETPGVHDCSVGLDGVWRVAETRSPVTTMMPSVDVHGWLGTEAALSLTSISKIVHDAQRITSTREVVVRGPVRRYTADEQKQMSHELADELDDVNEQLDALFALTKQLLDDTKDAIGL
ncbi:hypothetical protein [Leifsonia sp. Leaf264]|uniref:hypothetical protein n=1 Tax=Leifsonia sp. Leaf264 TaxID=1736314 RepID=UPI0006F31593|nr:hypothetical protein [Leifsonia sp. Leaf264]KQO98725.1 hypothetical protein ASF30_11730 [Leifsonia sp. Leaf264]